MAKYITQGTIKEIIVNIQSGGAMGIRLDPVPEFKIEAYGKTAIALAEADENTGERTVDLTESRNALLMPVNQKFNVQNVSIAELITLKNNGNRIELRFDDEKAVSKLVIL